MTDFDYRLRGHIVSPRSAENIRAVATDVRSVFKMGDFPVALPTFLESLASYGITVDVLDDEDFPSMIGGVEAICIPESATIALSNRTYRAAQRGDARTRFTIFHELGHFVLQHSKILHRKNFIAKPFIDSEWQADQFSAEMIMPLSVMLKLKLFTAEAVSKHFLVSQPAAATRIFHLQRKNLIPKSC